MYLLACVAEVIGISLCHFNDKFGRKTMMIVFLMVASAVCSVVALIPSSSNPDGSLSATSIIKIIFALIGKAMASSAFSSAYIFNSLLYPTHVRTTVILFASNIGKIGAFISPQINLLRTLVWQPLPYIIYSCSSFIAALSIFFIADPDKVKF